MEEEALFHGRVQLSDLLLQYPQKLAKDIDETDRNKVLNGSLSDLVDHFVSKYFLDVPRLRPDEAHILDPQDVRIDVSNDHRRLFLGHGPHYVQGTLYTLVVPFDGDPDMFSMQPSTYFMSAVSGAIQNDTLVFQHQQLEQDGAAVKRDFDGRLQQVESQLETQRRDVQGWNSKLPDTVRGLLEARKKKILDGLNLTESLGYPLKRRSDTTYSVPVTRSEFLCRCQHRRPPYTSPSPSSRCRSTTRSYRRSPACR